MTDCNIKGLEIPKLPKNLDKVVKPEFRNTVLDIHKRVILLCPVTVINCEILLVEKNNLYVLSYTGFDTPLDGNALMQIKQVNPYNVMEIAVDFKDKVLAISLSETPCIKIQSHSDASAESIVEYYRAIVEKIKILPPVKLLNRVSEILFHTLGPHSKKINVFTIYGDPGNVCIGVSMNAEDKFVVSMNQFFEHQHMAEFLFYIHQGFFTVWLSDETGISRKFEDIEKEKKRKRWI